VTVARPGSGYGGTGASFNAASPLLFNRALHGVDQALVLPGSADDYASIESVNLLDADTAHGEQSTGQVIVFTPHIAATVMSLEPVGDAYFGSNVRRFSFTAGDVSDADADEVVAVVGSTTTFYTLTAETYTFSIRVRFNAAWQANCPNADIRVSEEASFVGSTELDSGNAEGDVDGWQTVFLTLTIDAGDTQGRFAIRATGLDAYDGALDGSEAFEVDAVCLRKGTSTGFVPSINVVGDLDVRWRGSWRDWTPGGNGSTLAAQYASGDLAWTVGTDSSDHLVSIISDDGTATEEDSAGASPTVGNMEPLSVRALIVLGGTNETLFQQSDDADLSTASWSTVGSGQTTAKTEIHSAGGEPITIGYRQGAGSGADEQPMVIHAVQIRDGEDGPICAEVDFTDATAWPLTRTNLLDADMAHWHQAVPAEVGDVNCTSTQSAGRTPLIGDYHGRITADGVGTAYIYSGPYLASEGEVFAGGATVANGDGDCEAYVNLLWYSNADGTGYLGQTTGTITDLDDDDWYVLSSTGAAPASTQSVRVSVHLRHQDASAPDNGDLLDFDKVYLRTGSDTTFVPVPNDLAETDQGQTVTIHQGTDGARANVVDRSCWVGKGTDTWAYLTWADDDSLDFDATQDGTFVYAAQHSDATPPSNKYPFRKYHSGSSHGWLIGLSSGGVALVAVQDASANSATDLAGNLSDDTWRMNGAVLDRTAETLTAWLDTTESGSPADTSSVGTLESDSGHYFAFGYSGFYAWSAIFRTALSDAEMTELGTWDGTIANEPSWLRSTATLYVNADDYRQARNYTTHNEAVNLAVPSSWRFVLEAAFGQAWDDYATWTFTDITSDLIEFQISRSGDRTATFQTSTADIVLSNLTGTYTPGNTQSPHSGDIIPGVPIRLRLTTSNPDDITDGDQTIWTGFVWEWTPEWDTGMQHGVCRLRCEDGFKILANAALTSNISAGFASTQVGDILDDISWPATGRDLETSDTTFQSIVTEAAYALDTLRLVADSETGAVLMDEYGRVRFWDDSYLDGLTRSLSLYGPDIWAGSITMDDTQIYNKVLVQPINKALQTATDATSAGKYGPRTLARYGTVHNTTGDASTTASALLADYKDPSVRLTGITLKPDVDPWLWEQVAAVGLGDLVEVAFRPPGCDEFDTTDHVEGITHSWSSSDGEWLVELRTTPAMTPNSDDGAVLARLVAPGSLPAFVLAQDLQSDNYSAGSAGWKIERDSGDVEFNDGTFRGELSAATGTFAGSLSAVTGSLGDLSVTGTLTLAATGKLITDDTAPYIELGQSGDARTMWFRASASDNDGYLTFVDSGTVPSLTIKTPGNTVGGSSLYAQLQLIRSGGGLAFFTFDDTIDIGLSNAGVTLNLGGRYGWGSASAPSNTEWIEGNTSSHYLDFGVNSADKMRLEPTLLRPITTGGLSLGSGTYRFKDIYSGTLNLSSTLTVSGAATLSSTLSVGGHTTPSADITYDLGDATNTWRRLYAAQLRDGSGNLVMNINDLGINHGQITTGVADSGGSGYRLLRVPN